MEYKYKIGDIVKSNYFGTQYNGKEIDGITQWVFKPAYHVNGGILTEQEIYEAESK